MTDIPDYSPVIQKMRSFFASGETLDPAFRKGALLSLNNVILEHENDIFEALEADLNRPPCEAYMTEVGIVLSFLGHMARKVKAWSRARRNGRIWPFFPLFHL